MIEQLSLFHSGSSATELLRSVEMEMDLIGSHCAIDEDQLFRLLRYYSVLQLAAGTVDIESAAEEWRTTVARRFSGQEDRNKRRNLVDLQQCLALSSLKSTETMERGRSGPSDLATWLEHAFSALVANGEDVASGMTRLVGGSRSVKLIDRYFLTRNHNNNADVSRRLVASLDQGAELVVVAELRANDRSPCTARGSKPASLVDWRAFIETDSWCKQVIREKRCTLRIHVLAERANRTVHDRAIALTLHGGGTRAFVLGCGPGGWDEKRPIAVARLLKEKFDLWWASAIDECSGIIEL